MAAITLKDRVAIQELTHRYSLLLDTRRFDDAVDLFTNDGVFDETRIGIPTLSRGREELLGYFHGANEPIAHITHYVSNHIIELVKPGRARGTCYVHCEARLKNGAQVHVHGYYDDVYVKVRNRWRFKSRSVVPLLPTELGGFLEMAPIG